MTLLYQVKYYKNPNTLTRVTGRPSIFIPGAEAAPKHGKRSKPYTAGQVLKNFATNRYARPH